MALAEFQALGERFGIWFARTELADRIAVRGELAGACEQYEKALTVVTEVGSVDEIIRIRARLAQLRWLLGDEAASRAAIAEAHREAERVTWPDALADLALLEAELARWRGDVEDARQHFDLAIGLLGEATEQANIRAMTHDLAGYLADDLAEARTQRVAAYRAATEVGHAALIAQVLVGVADLALRHEQYEQSARLLAAGTTVRGLPDRSNPDAARIEQLVRARLGEARYAAAFGEGTESEWTELVSITLDF